MKIRISTLPLAGLDLKFPLDLPSLEARLALGDDPEIKFVAPPDVVLNVMANGSGAELVGNISFQFSQPCSRCLIGCPRSEIVKVHTFLKNAAEMEDAGDDPSIILFSDDHVDIEEHLQEAVIVSLGLYWSPEMLPSGSCSACGKSPEELGISTDDKVFKLNELLKKAGLN